MKDTRIKIQTVSSVTYNLGETRHKIYHTNENLSTTKNNHKKMSGYGFD